MEIQDSERVNMHMTKSWEVEIKEDHATCSGRDYVLYERYSNKPKTIFGLIRAISSEKSRAAFGRKYDIPIRTLETWEAGISSAPRYLINLLTRAVMEDSNYYPFIYVTSRTVSVNGIGNEECLVKEKNILSAFDKAFAHKKTHKATYVEVHIFYQNPEHYFEDKEKIKRPDSIEIEL